MGTLNNLALLYRERKNEQNERLMHERSLALEPIQLDVVRRLALLYARAGEIEKSPAAL